MEKKNPTVVIINPATGESKTLTRLSYDEVWEVLEEMEDNRVAADSALTGEPYKAGQRELEGNCRADSAGSAQGYQHQAR